MLTQSGNSVVRPGTDYAFTAPRTLPEKDPEGRQVHHLFLSALVVLFSHIVLQLTLEPLEYEDKAAGRYQRNQLFAFLPLPAA